MGCEERECVVLMHTSVIKKSAPCTQEVIIHSQIQTIDCSISHVVPQHRAAWFISVGYDRAVVDEASSGHCWFSWVRETESSWVGPYWSTHHHPGWGEGGGCVCVCACVCVCVCVCVCACV